MPTAWHNALDCVAFNYQARILDGIAINSSVVGTLLFGVKGGSKVISGGTLNYM